MTADLQYSHVNTGAAAGDNYDSIENLHGSHSDDILRGDTGNNKIWEGNGHDALYGRGGNDILVGQGGNDTFVFEDGYDRDTILDFQDDIDTIQLRDFGLLSVHDATSHATQDGSDVVFDFGGVDVLRVASSHIQAIQDDISIL